MTSYSRYLMMHYFLMGNFYGYPVCCIQSFIEHVLLGQKRTAIQSDESIHQCKGFIPCHKHALQILAGNITLDKLIEHRRCKRPFSATNPHENDSIEFNRWVKKIEIQ